MRLQLKRTLDYYVGRPILAVLNVVARVLGQLLRRDHGVQPVRTVLIVKFQGLGSLVLAKPALARLRSGYPQAKILFWGTEDMKSLADQMPEFDEVLVLDERTLLHAVFSVFYVLLRLWRERIDWAVDLEVYSRFSSVLVTLTCARNRTGFALEQIRSRRVHTHLVYFNRHKFLGDAYERIIGLLLPADTIVKNNDYGRWRFELDPLLFVPSRYIVFNIHAGDLALERRWPRESFQLLIDKLLNLCPEVVAVLIGHGDLEVAYNSGLCKGDRVIDLAGRLSLSETFRLLANAELVVTNDTAPLHFALSTHAKVVGLFGPTLPEIYIPPGRANAATASVSLYCSPCVHYWEPSPCNGDNQCMKRLSVTKVLTTCCDLLGIRAPSHTSQIPERKPSNYYPGLVYERQSRTTING